MEQVDRDNRFGKEDKGWLKKMRKEEKRETREKKKNNNLNTRRECKGRERFLRENVDGTRNRTIDLCPLGLNGQNKETY